MDTKTIIDNIEAKAMSFEAKAMKTIHYVSGFFSLLLTPMLMPTYGMIVALWMSNLLILTLQTKMTVMLVVFGITCLVPALLFLLLKKLKVISEFGINDRRERLVPYIIMIVCYVAAAVYLFMINAPEWLGIFVETEKGKLVSEGKWDYKNNCEKAEVSEEKTETEEEEDGNTN